MGETFAPQAHSAEAYNMFQDPLYSEMLHEFGPINPTDPTHSQLPEHTHYQGGESYAVPVHQESQQPALGNYMALWLMNTRLGMTPTPQYNDMTPMHGALHSGAMMQYHGHGPGFGDGVRPGPEAYAAEMHYTSHLGTDNLHLPLDAVLLSQAIDVPAPSYNNPPHGGRSMSDSAYPEAHGMYAYAHHSDKGKQQPQASGMTRPRVVRGSISGGSVTKPPSSAPCPGYSYAPARLVYDKDELEGVCNVRWGDMELMDGRRIVRIERTQAGATIRVHLTIVGLAVEKPDPAPAPAGVSVVEVSCLHKTTLDCGLAAGYYITSVEVVSIVETLIGVQNLDAAQRRRERGRIRSNLLAFWQKRPLLSKKTDHDNGEEQNEFARRIMAYEIRRPRGFDKGVRVLDWSFLGAALERALQCYYVETPMLGLT